MPTLDEAFTSLAGALKDAKLYSWLSTIRPRKQPETIESYTERFVAEHDRKRKDTRGFMLINMGSKLKANCGSCDCMSLPQQDTVVMLTADSVRVMGSRPGVCLVFKSVKPVCDSKGWCCELTIV